jgi:hypothetical protein
MSDLQRDQHESEDLFDFPEVRGFSPEFLEAARLQTEAANATSPEARPDFGDQGDAGFAEPDGKLDDGAPEDEFTDDFADEFTDDFADLMGDAMPEALPVEEPAVPAASTPVATSTGFGHRFVWGALTLLLAANLLWAWTWHASEDRLRGEMDQRFQGYLASQRDQLNEAVTALTPATDTLPRAQGERPPLMAMATVDEAGSLLGEIKRDLMRARYETARTRAWRLIARVDAIPAERRSSVEASARLLIAESYEIQGTENRESEG